VNSSYNASGHPARLPTGFVRASKEKPPPLTDGGGQDPNARMGIIGGCRPNRRRRLIQAALLSIVDPVV
jgi:hypothetical protein